MDLGLRNKVILITGSSRGIGRAIADAFAAEGARLSLCARDPANLHRATDDLRATGATVLATAADVSTSAGVRTVVDETLRAYGRVDVLVNNVGGSRPGDFLDNSDADWQAVLDLNVLAAVRACRLVIPHMRAQGGGSIVNIASVWGRESGGAPSYNVAKAAEISLAKQLARQYAPDGIRVNSVAPGSVLFAGGSWERRMKDDPEGMAQFVKTQLPYGRFGRPEEVADVVVFLASSKASLVSGACVAVDGVQGRSNI